MDELEKLRQAWTILHHGNEKGHPQPDTLKIIRKRSGHAVSRFSRSLMIEIWIGIVVLAGMPFMYLWHPYLQYLNHLIVLFFMLLACTIYYFVQYRKLTRETPRADADIRTSLAQMLQWMQDFVIAYLRMNQVLLVFCLMILMVIGMNSPEYQALTIEGFTQFLVIIVVILIIAIVTLAFYPIQKVYIRWMFGRYIDQLRESLKELEENGGN